MRYTGKKFDAQIGASKGASHINDGLHHSVNRSDNQQGFTLIEVLVALSIFAVVAVAAINTATGSIRTTEHIRSKVLAQFVASNIAADIALQNNVQVGSEFTVEENGYNWSVQLQSADTPKLVSSEQTNGSQDSGMSASENKASQINSTQIGASYLAQVQNNLNYINIIVKKDDRVFANQQVVVAKN